MRIYDNRLGRFLSVDPLAKSYPMLTPYQFASNRPIDGIDRDGLEFTKASSFKLQYNVPTFGSVYFQGQFIQIQTNKTITLATTKDLPEYYKVNPVPMEYDPSGQHEHPNGTIRATTPNKIEQPDAPEDGVSGKDGTNPYLPSNDKVGVLIEGIKLVTQGVAYLVDKKHIDAESKVQEDAVNFNRAVSLVGKFADNYGLKIPDKIKSDVINFVNDGTLPFDAKDLTKEQAKYNNSIKELGTAIYEKRTEFGYSKKHDKEYIKSR